jgi:hypothetical protein
MYNIRETPFKNNNNQKKTKGEMEWSCQRVSQPPVMAPIRISLSLLSKNFYFVLSVVVSDSYVHIKRSPTFYNNKKNGVNNIRKCWLMVDFLVIFQNCI